MRTSASWGRAAEPGPAEPDPADQRDMELQVLIPTRSRPAELAVTLAGLAAQQGVEFGVVLSDQSPDEPDWSHPAAASMVRVLEAQGRSVRRSRNLPLRGMAQQRQHLLDLSAAAQVLYLDDDVWLEPGTLSRLREALETLGCGFVGMAVQGLSFLDDRRPSEWTAFDPWKGPVRPERLARDEPGFRRWPLHNAANLTHLAAELDLSEDQWQAYKVAWVGGCVLFDRQALVDAGGFSFWPGLPPDHAGEDVAAQWNVMAACGGAGILPSGAVHLESPTSVTQRRVDAFDVVPVRARPAIRPGTGGGTSSHRRGPSTASQGSTKGKHHGTTTQPH